MVHCAWEIFFKMAAKMGEGFLDKIEKNIYSVLYIIKSENILKLHQFLKTSLLENFIIPKYVNIFEERFRNSSIAPVFTFTFYRDCGIAQDGIVATILPKLSDVSSENLLSDLRTLLNFYVNETFKCGHSADNVNSIDDLSCEEDNGNETERALYCLAGGTLCELLKVNKRRSSNPKLTAHQRHSAKLVSEMAKSFSMTSEEKNKSLPVELKARDRGSIIFPKVKFLPYIRAVNMATKKYLTEAALKKRNLLTKGRN